VHIVVVYRSLQDASRVFVTIGVRERGPVDALFRSPVMFSWFDSAGVDEIPPMFVGQVVEKLSLDPDTLEARPAATGTRSPGAVIVGAIAPVGRLEGLDRLRASVHAAVPRLTASGVRRFWIYRALDDQAEVMILQEIATERQADHWIRHPDAAASFMAEAGAGAYPPLFVGRLVQAIELPGTEMYICLCLGVMTSTVQQAIDAGARSTKQVAEACGAGSVCGRCGHTIRTMIEATAPDPPSIKPDRLRRRWGRT
jgi:bacterioferritin-associated ferredoxin